MPAAQSGIRIRRGDTFAFAYAASAAPTNVQGELEAIDDFGVDRSLSIPVQTSFTTDRSLNYVFGERADFNGWITAAWLDSQSSLKRGQFYAIIYISRNSRIHKLASAYLYPSHDAISLGEFVEPGPSGGIGVPLKLDIGNPAAGVQYTTQTVPTGAVWKPLGMEGSIATSAVVGARQPIVQYSDGTNNIAHGPATGFIPANSAGCPFSAGVGVGSLGGASDTNHDIPIPLPVAYLPAGYTINFYCKYFDAGDNFGQGYFLVEEWVVP